MSRMPRYHFWIICHDPDSGKPFLIYGNTDESVARQKALEMLSGVDFEIKRYPTRDLGRASSFYRGKRLENGDGLKKSTERVGHEKSLARLKRKTGQKKHSSSSSVIPYQW